MTNCCDKNEDKKNEGNQHTPFQIPQMHPCACSNTVENAKESALEKEQDLSGACACSSLSTKKQNSTPDSEVNKVKYFGIGFLSFLLWYLLYSFVKPAASYITFDLFGLDKASSFSLAFEFFIYDTAKIMLLLVFMVYLIAWLRADLDTEKIKNFLVGKVKGLGYLLAACFGAVTPFCSCSSVPLFIAFTNARIPIGITMAFLITSPLINEVAIIILWGLLGWKFTLVYIGVGLLAGVIGGIIMDFIKADRWLQDFLLEQLKTKQLTSLTLKTSQKIPLMQRHFFAKNETIGITKKVWKWVIVGVGLGALLHNYVPQDWFEQNLGAGQWWSVPLAVMAGIPLYTNVTGIIPIMESLLVKGLPAGTTLAFCMSAVGASLPEILMLKQVMKWKLLAVFGLILLVIFTLVGWVFNYAQYFLI